MPLRIQRGRAKGWRMPPNTVSVTRPGRWGNPYAVGGELTLERALVLFRATAQGGWSPANVADLSDAAAESIYRAHCAFIARIGGHVHEWARSELRGRNLACWCALPAPGQPDLCHAAILLELANS